VAIDKRLEEIRERAEKATKGPWFWRKCYEIGRRHWALKSPESEAEGRVVGIMGTLAFDDFTPPEKWHADPNNQFIAHSREDIPYLLRELAEVSAKLAEIAVALGLPAETADIASCNHLAHVAKQAKENAEKYFAEAAVVSGKLEQAQKERDSYKRLYLHHDDTCCLAEHDFDCGGLHAELAALRLRLEELEAQQKEGENAEK